MTTAQLLTIPETARALRCSKTTVYSLIASGELRAVNMAMSNTRTHTRIRADDLAALIDKRTQRAVVPA